MKRAFVILLMLSLLICGCSNASDSETTVDTPESSSVETSEETTLDTTEEEVKPVVLYRHPLTGEPLDAPFTGRATAVVVNNIQAAQPLYGIGSADVLYEIETEGGITRMLAVFTDLENVGAIGPIRSARTFFNNIAVSYDAPIVHCGGSVRGRNAGYKDSEDKIDNWAHLDAYYYETSYFYRDANRKAQGYAYEHRLFSTGELLKKGLEARKVSAPTDRSCDFGLQFSDDVQRNGDAANTVTVTFWGDKTTTFTYDAVTGVYETAQYGADCVDANTGKVVTFKNIMVLYTSQWKRHDGEYNRSYYELTGTGDGYLVVNGQAVPIQWSREGLRSNFVYKLADGTPITLGVGTTYIAIASESSTPLAYK